MDFYEKKSNWKVGGGVKGCTHFEIKGGGARRGAKVSYFYPGKSFNSDTWGIIIEWVSENYLFSGFVFFSPSDAESRDRRKMGAKK